MLIILYLTRSNAVFVLPMILLLSESVLNLLNAFHATSVYTLVVRNRSCISRKMTCNRLLVDTTLGRIVLDKSVHLADDLDYVKILAFE